MTTIKSYTDLEQSKVLANILPLESADMHYSKDFDGRWFVDLAKYTSVKIPKYVGNVEEHLLPCWSLAALLGVLPLPDLIQDKADDELFCQCSVYDEDGTLLCETYDNNPVDACVAMIENLHELKML